MMKRKRAVKLMMARGYSRNRANSFMCHKRDGISNLSVYQTCLSFDRAVNHALNCFAQVSRFGCGYGIGPDAILNSRFPKSALAIEPMMQI